MPKLKVLGGKDVVKIFSRFGFVIVSQRGSHVKLRRTLPDGTKQSLTIPLHEELDKGTLKAIYRQALRFIPEEELKPHFYD
ncbi:MAG: type II toxin-antitoxin system HicA family toxin [Thermoproteota archaeon]|nr:type II toxin-antitoxin system HicA family toxin [Candidatus Brockarchaeota archaeon]MBO3840745.1 type II toxin-antitoxin system HicA family toxin [Candidatus Brockarchaeota archaeon]